MSQSLTVASHEPDTNKFELDELMETLKTSAVCPDGNSPPKIDIL
jgi:hypothetical protein